MTTSLPRLRSRAASVLRRLLPRSRLLVVVAPRNADAATDMAKALREVAGSMRVKGSPEIRAEAVQLMEEDGDLSDGECVSAMRLFTKEIAVAQTYLASKNKDRRTAYLHSAIEDAGFF
ncbi:Myb-DNA-bind-3 domain-containing protein [Mycena kentingensis (nom. inval.)]|nr:Myb-DNA-bind-3 domain-containing protein [Mycena kentingensis (nom. inval.)]